MLPCVTSEVSSCHAIAQITVWSLSNMQTHTLLMAVHLSSAKQILLPFRHWRFLQNFLTTHVSLQFAFLIQLCCWRCTYTLLLLRNSRLSVVNQGFKTYCEDLVTKIKNWLAFPESLKHLFLILQHSFILCYHIVSVCAHVTILAVGLSLIM